MLKPGSNVANVPNKLIGEKTKFLFGQCCHSLASLKVKSCKDWAASFLKTNDFENFLELCSYALTMENKIPEQIILII